MAYDDPSSQPTLTSPAAPPAAVRDAEPELLRQPLLHDLVTCFASPTVVLSAPDGQVRAEGAQGVLHADVRVLSRAEVLVDGREPEPIAGTTTGSGEAVFTALMRWVGEAVSDPSVRLDRTRRVSPGLVQEELRVGSTAPAPVSASVALHLAADLVPIELIKRGATGAAVRLEPGDASARWATEDVTAELTAPGARVEQAPDGTGLVVTWDVQVGARSEVSLGWRLAVSDSGGAVVAAPRERPATPPSLTADDRRLAPWLRQSLADLDALRMATRERPDDVFVAAGAPWYLTLFGRDSIWAARLLLPLGTDLAGGTLRTLAALQGTTVDDSSGEAPGKIPHELRRAETVHGSWTLPPLYYGTVDATPLWVCLLHDAWRWGLPADQVEELLPHLERALEWMATDGDADGDGFLEYVDASGRGLSNQGWKDSEDAVRFADGTQAVGPIALCEVQGYAHEAAVSGAALLEAFGRPGADRWRAWAEEMAQRFRAAFWVGEGAERRPALALDGAKRPVDATTSNIGHLLGTGLLDAEEEALVAARVTAADMDGGLGLRTMSDRDGGYAPLSYHCGSVWPHDTAIVVRGLARSGHGDRATGLVEGLLAASQAWDGRLPELWSGEPWPMVPYPAACRPQAWSAAAAVTVLEAVLGLRVDVPAGTLAVRPLAPSPLGRVDLDGLVVGGEPVRLSVGADGSVQGVEGTALRVVG